MAPTTTRKVPSGATTPLGSITSDPPMCPACAKAPLTPWFDKVNCADGLTYGVYRCGACRSSFVWPRPGVEEIEQFYRRGTHKSAFDEKRGQLRESYFPTAFDDAKRIIACCRRLARGPHLLDVGAGNGEFSSVARKYGFFVDACEPNPQAREAFRDLNGFYPDPTMFDDAYVSQKRERYDVVLLSHVLEHMLQADQVTVHIRRVLRRRGIAVIAVPHFRSLLSRLQGKRDMFICPPEHLNFFTRAGLIRMFERSGFRLLRVETVSKVPRGKIERKLGGRFLAQAAWRGLYATLHMADLIGAGMVINAYFRKT